MAAFCQRYLDGRDKLAPATRSRYEAYLKHVERDLGAVPLSRFTPRVAASWKKKQLESGDLSPSTVRKHLVFVGAAMNAGGRLAADRREPDATTSSCRTTSRRRSTSTRRPSRRRYSLPRLRGTATRAGTTRAAAKGSLYVPVVLDLATGLRRGELLGLRVTDVDLARSRLHVRQALRKERRGGR